MAAPAKDQSGLLQPGASFGRYRIEKVLGRGGMGAVYEATHLELKKRVAVKILLPSVAENVEVRTRFLREGQAVARINHPHVVDIYDVGTQDGITYLVMELLEGEDLGRTLKRETAFSAARAADLLIPVLAAIHAAHEERIIHRDLKPANIFLSKDRRGQETPKVVDFGISKMVTDDLSEGLTSTGAVLGTPFYMSPEQAHGEKSIDARSDQYSLAVIMYQCVTGQRPFQADSMYQILHKIVQGSFEPPRAVRPEIPEGLERIIMKGMARSPADRYPSLREMGQALLAYASDRVRAQWEPTFGTADLSALSAAPPAPPAAPLPAAALREPGVSGSHTLGAQSTAGATLAPVDRSRGLFLAGAALLLVAALVALYAAFLHEPSVQTIALPTPVEPVRPPAPVSYAVEVQVEPAEAELFLDGASAGHGTLRRSFQKDGSEHTLRATMSGYESTTVVFKDAPPPARLTLAALPAPPPAKKEEAAAKKSVKPPRERPPAEDKTKKGANEALIIR